MSEEKFPFNKRTGRNSRICYDCANEYTREWRRKKREGVEKKYLRSDSWTDQEMGILRECISDGITAKETITRLPGRSLYAMYEVRRRSGLPKFKRVLPKRVDHSEVFRLLANGKSYAEIAKAVNKTSGAIGLIVHRYRKRNNDNAL